MNALPTTNPASRRPPRTVRCRSAADGRICLSSMFALKEGHDIVATVSQRSVATKAR